MRMIYSMSDSAFCCFKPKFEIQKLKTGPSQNKPPKFTVYNPHVYMYIQDFLLHGITMDILWGDCTPIYELYLKVCAAVKGMVFSEFTLE